jgi:hypothetical protein
MTAPTTAPPHRPPQPHSDRAVRLLAAIRVALVGAATAVSVALNVPHAPDRLAPSSSPPSLRSPSRGRWSC